MEDNKENIYDELVHYFISNRFNIATSAILLLQRDINKWIMNGTPGAIIYGRPRIGKTSAIMYIASALKAKYGIELPIFVYNATEHTPKDKFFYSEFLKTVGHAEFDKGTVSVLKDRLLNTLMTRACNTKYKKIILFIDEAYNFSEKDFTWLMDIYNNLYLKDIHMTVILVGSEELKARKHALILAKQHQIVGRFMVEEVNFRGITNAKDIAICLLNFDKPLKFKEDSIILTEKYFPDAFKDNLTLASCSEILMGEYTSIMKEMNIPLTSDIPMMYFINTVKYCLNEYGTCGKGIYFPDKKAWRDSIQNSGYVMAEKVLYEAPIG